MFGEEKSKQVAKIPLSSDTVKRRISRMSEDIIEHCAAKLHSNVFTSQIEESTDMSKMSHLLAYVCNECKKRKYMRTFCFVKSYNGKLYFRRDGSFHDVK